MPRSASSPIWLYAVAVLASHGAMPINPSCASAGDSITVQADDGRILTGEVDARTGENLLWLRCTAPSIAITSPIRWGKVVSVRHGDREFSAAEFRPLAERLKSKLPEDFFSSEAAKRTAARRDGTPKGETRSTQSAQPTSREGPHARQQQKVRSLHVQAAVVNWDADVEVDGLELRILPYADDGSIVPADGMLSVRLIGHYLLATTHHLDGLVDARLRTSARKAFRELGRWSKRVRATDYRTWGAVYRFPFQNIHPEFNLDFGADGLVHAKLGVPGQGNFEASVPVNLRFYSPLREQLQLHEHRRFFPTERTGWRGR